MRLLPIIAIAVLPTLAAAQARDVEVHSTIERATVYPDGATVTRFIRVDLPRGETTLVARDFPLTLDPASLRVEGETAARIAIGAIDARVPPASLPETAPDLEKQIEALRDRRGVLEDEIGAHTARKSFIERFAENVPLGLGDKADARPIADWRAAFAAVAEEMIAADRSIREVQLRQRDLDRQIARLEAEMRSNPPRKMEVRVELAADAASAATLRVSYTVRGARWVPLYDARLDSGARDRKAALELVRRAEIVQKTGEDWVDVALSVSTVRTAKGGNAPDLSPLLVRYPEANPKLADRASGRVDEAHKVWTRSVSPFVDTMKFSGFSEPASTEANTPEPVSMPTVEQEATIDSAGYQVMFQIPGRVSIATGDAAKSFRVSTATLAPDLLVRATPALDDTAYLEAAFKHAEDAPLLPGRVALYRDGIYAGRGQLALAAKDETVRIGFGADDRVKVTRAMVRRNEGSTGLISSSKTDEREFKIAVRNGHDMPVRIAIEDQLPVSETAEVAVEMLNGMTPPTARDVRDRRGVVAWTLDAAAGEARDIRFGWRVRWPADKTITFEPRRP
jgi:uncharacterized protein (TIGR02231 family)